MAVFTCYPTRIQEAYTLRAVPLNSVVKVNHPHIWIFDILAIYYITPLICLCKTLSEVLLWYGQSC